MPAFIYTAEIFPTRARGTAAAIGDGLGHLGGAIAPVVVLPVLVGFGGAAAVWVITGLTLLSGLIVTFGVRTRNRSLTEIAS
jgi:putative MFS transporter